MTRRLPPQPLILTDPVPRTPATPADWSRDPKPPTKPQQRKPKP